jgi:SpoVK/Ycf46/Vps4 family AAA+-type ATPase
MAVFNFDIKRQSYEIALKQTQEALVAGDVESGKYYLSRAIELCSQLINNCIVQQMKEKYIMENKKLLSLKNTLDKGGNPFVKQREACQPQTAGDEGQDKAPSTSGDKGGEKATEKDGKPKSRFFADKVPTTRLCDVAGLADVKKQIRLRVIAPMRDPDLYKKYMSDVGCQILMYGPPGCGKSFVAEAIAGELGCAYAIINASDLLEKYVGEGPKKVVQIFEDAKQYDNCLIFFDELDSIFSSRESEDSRHTKDVLTTFLTCLSGFHSDESGGVRVIIGATNRPWALDSALIRGKRFDTHIYVGLPDEEARAFLINKAFKKTPTLLEGSDVTKEKLVELYDGYSCADISSMIDKIKTLALERALNDRDEGIDKDEPVMMADVESVLKSYRNSVTPDSIEAFKAFERGEI